MYEPTTGRWSTVDPKGFEAGDADLYRFVGNDPTNATDPSGLYEEPVAMAPSPAIPGKAVAGEDVTVALKDGMKNVEKKFNSLSDAKKLQMAQLMINPRGWDISDFIGGGVPAQFKGTGDLQETVTVDGGVYYSYEVNYILWGKLCRLVHDWVADRLHLYLDGTAKIAIKDDEGQERLVPLTKYLDKDDPYSLASALNLVTKYRSVAWAKDFQFGNGRLDWTKAGWYDGEKPWSDYTSGSAIKGATPNRKASYKGVLTIAGGMLDKDTAILEATGQAPQADK